mmetsp:Transcript_16502/g.52841  ORF Transcript_16502/g.52841 Transcript_16502/m.52841 type:complete len:266 (+) Transcript_16502:64-861(+)
MAQAVAAGTSTTVSAARAGASHVEAMLLQLSLSSTGALDEQASAPAAPGPPAASRGLAGSRGYKPPGIIGGAAQDPELVSECSTTDSAAGPVPSFPNTPAGALGGAFGGLADTGLSTAPPILRVAEALAAASAAAGMSTGAAVASASGAPSLLPGVAIAAPAPPVTAAAPTMATAAAPAVVAPPAAMPAAGMGLPMLLGSPMLPSLGSEGHEMGVCRPCAFIFKEGCQGGYNCKFCHLCPPGEKKRRMKARKTMRRLAYPAPRIL